MLLAVLRINSHHFVYPLLFLTSRIKYFHILIAHINIIIALIYIFYSVQVICLFVFSFCVCTIWEKISDTNIRHFTLCFVLDIFVYFMKASNRLVLKNVIPSTHTYMYAKCAIYHSWCWKNLWKNVCWYLSNPKK